MIAVLAKSAAPRQICAILNTANDIGSIAPKPIFKIHAVLPKMIPDRVDVSDYFL